MSVKMWINILSLFKLLSMILTPFPFYLIHF